MICKRVENVAHIKPGESPIGEFSSSGACSKGGRSLEEAPISVI